MSCPRCRRHSNRLAYTFPRPVTLAGAETPIELRMPSGISSITKWATAPVGGRSHGSRDAILSKAQSHRETRS